MNENKLPVFRTLGNALSFTVGNYFTVLRLAWLPFTLLLAANFGLGTLMGLPFVERVKTPLAIFEHIDQLAFLQVTMWILQLLVIAAVAVSVHRIILFGDRRPGVWLSFRFGRTELVYAVMAFLWALMIVSILAAVLLPALLLVSGGDPAALFAQAQEWVKELPRGASIAPTGVGALLGLGLAYFVGWIIALYVMLRLCVWPPAVVATNALSPAEPWRLTNGNTLRLFGLFALTLVVFYFVMLVVILSLVFAFRDQLAHLPAPAAPTETQMGAERERIRELVASYLVVYWPVLWAVALLIYTAAISVTVALISYSYKALKGYDANEPIPDAA